jgi:hypothetical protein
MEEQKQQITSKAYNYIEGLIEEFLNKSNITFSIAAGFYDKTTKKSEEEDSVENHFLLYALPLAFLSVSDDKKMKIPTEALKQGFSEWKKMQWKKTLIEIKKELSFAESKKAVGQIAIKTWLTSILWREPSELEFVVIEHFIHQVKRKLFNRPVSYHLMPILVAAQGSGKTESLNWLLKPLGKLKKDTQITSLEDDRNIMLHSSAYVMVFDEMARADRADIRVLKDRITATEVNTRVLGKNLYKDIKQNTTFIAASNERIDSLLSDSTGMRRFAQVIGPDKKTIDSMTEEDKQKFWQLKDSIEVETIWQSIDENETILPGFLKNLKFLEAEQEVLRFKDSVEEFLEASHWSPAHREDLAPAQTPSIKPDVIYGEYQMFCENTGEPFTLSLPKFRKKLTAHGFIAGIVKNERVLFASKPSPGEQAAKTLAKIAVLKKGEPA